jgi:hypothetical protein
VKSLLVAVAFIAHAFYLIKVASLAVGLLKLVGLLFVSYRIQLALVDSSRVNFDCSRVLKLLLVLSSTGEMLVVSEIALEI